MPTDPCRDVVLSDSWIEALLREPLVRWPEVSPVAVREIVESTDGVGTAILAVVVDAASLERSDLTEQVIAALSEAVAGTYPAWLPEAEHLAGPGGAGLAAVRTICERVACSTDLFGPFLIGAAEASLCGRPVGVAGFAQETAVRQARKLILLRVWALGHRHRADGCLEHRADRSRGSERALARRARRAYRVALRDLDRSDDARAPFGSISSGRGRSAPSSSMDPTT